MLKEVLLTLVPYILVAGTSAKAPLVLPEGHIVLKRADLKATETITVVEEMIKDPIQRETWARAAFGFEYWESSWMTSPVGYNDNGDACGTLQTHTPHLILPGATCDKVRRDAKLAIKVALTFLLEREKTCGSKAAAWTAFATNGSCPKNWVLQLVKNRCRSVGLTEECEMKPGKVSAYATK